MKPQTSPQPEGVDELLTVLADRHRRAVLAYFHDSVEDVASVADLANAIEKQNHGGTEYLTATLHHSTLPKLAAFDVLNYDTSEGMVRYRGHPELETLAGKIKGI